MDADKDEVNEGEQGNEEGFSLFAVFSLLFMAAAVGGTLINWVRGGDGDQRLLLGLMLALFGVYLIFLGGRITHAAWTGDEETFDELTKSAAIGFTTGVPRLLSWQWSRYTAPLVAVVGVGMVVGGVWVLVVVI